MNIDSDTSINSTHIINISERQNISITGVTKINSFDKEEFLIDTISGKLGIKGKNLEIIKLDTYSGTISIKGIVDALSYLSNEKSKEKGIISKLLK